MLDILLRRHSPQKAVLGWWLAGASDSWLLSVQRDTWDRPAQIGATPVLFPGDEDGMLGQSSATNVVPIPSCYFWCVVGETMPLKGLAHSPQKLRWERGSWTKATPVLLLELLVYAIGEG